MHFCPRKGAVGIWAAFCLAFASTNPRHPTGFLILTVSLWDLGREVGWEPYELFENISQTRNWDAHIPSGITTS